MNKSFITLIHFVFLFFNYQLNAQVFNKIITGPIVNDGGSTYGSAWVDFDHDNDQDLFITTVYDENDQLYINNGNGNFSLFSNNLIVQDGIYSYSSTWADIDKDGWEDCFITHGNYYAPDQYNTLFKNNTMGAFNKIPGGIASNDLGNSDGATWADYDNDGYIDLFIANYNNGPNFLYHNTGNNAFTKVTDGSVVTDVAPASAMGAWGDYDNDGYLDLFVANFGSVNYLYHNDSNGVFTKITTGDIVSDVGDSHGASWGDYDNDGFLDLFVNRWYNQNDLLFHNNGNGTFTKVTNSPIVNNSGWGTGSSWGDYDNDGDLDLIVGNSSAFSTTSYNYLYENKGDGNFETVNSLPFTDDVSYARGVTWCDFDNDGDLDLHISNEYYNNDFLLENTGNSNHWINIHLTGVYSNRSAIGACVRVKAIIGGVPVWQMNFVSSQTGYSGENSLNVEFGFGNATIIDSIVVEWPSGHVSKFSNVFVDQFVVITELGVLTNSIDNIANEENKIPISVFPNPLINDLHIKIDKIFKGKIDIKLFDEMGRVLFSKNAYNLNELIIPGDELPKVNGIYFLNIQFQEKTYWQKFILNK